MMRFRNLSLRPLWLGALLAPSLAFSAWNHFDPTDTSQVPKLFSQTGFYSNMAAKTITSEAVPYEVNSALWSDNAHKYRWILLKPGAEKIKFDANQDYYDYPDGAVFIKLFKHDTSVGDTTSRIYWETRLLVLKKRLDTLSTSPLQVEVRDVWHPFSYRWHTNGSDAELVSQASGAVASMNLTVKGQHTFRKWFFPSAQACNTCHRQYENGMQGRAVLGFFTPQINRPTKTNLALNQIRNFFTAGIFTATPAPTDAQIAALPKWAAIDDTTAPLDLRAKSYIASNCSGCHGTRGIATQAIYPAGDHVNYDFLPTTAGSLAWTVDISKELSIEFPGMPKAVSPNGDTLQPGLVVPGYPQISTVLFRMTVRNESNPSDDTAYAKVGAQMPPLGVYEQDTIAIRWITKWIAETPALGLADAMRGQVKWAPRLQGSFVTMPQGFDGHAFVAGIDGRRHELIRVMGNTYQLPSALPKGILFLYYGHQAYKLIR